MPNSRYDVIIVGGGFTGVSAARELTQLGKSVLVLEAKERLGGRAWSADLNGVPIELGGGYVYWSQPHVWNEINRYHLSVKERPYYARTNTMQQTRFLINGELKFEFTAEESKQISAAFQEYVKPAKVVFPHPFNPFYNDEYKKYDSLSNEDRVNQLELTKLQKITLLRTTSIQCNNAPSNGAYLEAMRWYALANSHDETYADSLSRFSIKEGTTHLLHCIAEDSQADFVLQSKVAKVSKTSTGVEVSSSTGTYSAEHCLIATPVNTWKNIVFDPIISDEKLQLSNEELSGKGHKIYIELKGKFKDSRWSSINTPILSVLPHVIGDEKSVVIAFSNPEFPMEDITIDSLQREINRWDKAYKVLDFKFHDWSKDDHILGTWGNFRPQQFSKYFKNALTPEGNVFFSGGDIAKGWRGFIDGAIESGISTARKIYKTKIG